MNIKIYAAVAGMALAAPVLAQDDPSFDISGVEVVQELADRVPDNIRARGTLIIGSDNAYAPWEYLAGADGQTPEGIDVDLGKAIARTLDLEFESRTAPFASILPALGASYDLGLSAFSITAERTEAVNFVSYAGSINLWAVKAGNPADFDPADICGQTLAIQTGSAHEKLVSGESERCVAEGQSAITILPFSNIPEALTRVVAGGAPATLAGGATIGYAVAQSNGQLEYFDAVGAVDKTSLNGIAVAKSDMALTQLLADTVNHLIETGVYGGIYDHWGVSALKVEEALVNPEITW